MLCRLCQSDDASSAAATHCLPCSGPRYSVKAADIKCVIAGPGLSMEDLEVSEWVVLGWLCSQRSLTRCVHQHRLEPGRGQLVQFHPDAGCNRHESGS